jgi:hypothetical protein
MMFRTIDGGMMAAETTGYFIAGIAAIYGVILIYIGSLWIRVNRLGHQSRRMDEMRKTKTKADG